VAGQPGWGGVDPLVEAARLGMAGRVRVLGRVPDADLAVLMARATALVVPSRAEGFGLPMLEAMSLGTAVVTSPDAALVEVAGGASLVASDDELATVLRGVVEDDVLRARLGAAGRERAAAFTWDAAADALWAMYGEIGAEPA
jgi:glycosyltransferase involved in cell wall biosynthesis